MFSSPNSSSGYIGLKETIMTFIEVLYKVHVVTFSMKSFLLSRLHLPGDLKPIYTDHHIQISVCLVENLVDSSVEAIIY
jgi:hypothetical protein